MKILKSKWFNILLWIALLIPFSLWLYVWLFVGTANTNIDNICYPLSIVFLVIMVIKRISLSIITEYEQ